MKKPGTATDTKPTKWNVEVDAMDYDIAGGEVDAKLQIPIAGDGSRAQVRYPSSPSDFVVVGSGENREIWTHRAAEKQTDISGRLDDNKLALSPDGAYFAAKNSGFAKSIKLWDVKAKAVLGELPLPPNTVLQFIDFAGTKRPVARPFNQALSVWSIPSCDPERTINLPTVIPGSMTISHDVRSLVQLPHVPSAI